MTRDPSCCLPGDSVAMAAQIMKREDVGPVLVVSDHFNKRLVGIVTDRDLALKVVAEGRDPHNTRIDEVMSPNPITCREEDTLETAIRYMSEYQVRRIPVVDGSGSLTGIIAQADIARLAEDEQVGELVEDISQPFGSEQWSERHGGGLRRSLPEASALAVGALCVGVGAGLMYLFDPTRGRRRRGVLRDKAGSYLSTTSETVRRTSDELRNRASGVYAATRSRIRRPDERVDDLTLQDRVRSKLGHYVSNPHAIEVKANQGHITLTGSVPATEVAGLIRCVRGVSGVHSIENLLEVQNTAGEHNGPSQGWGTGMRVLSTAVGGGLMLYGLRSRSGIGKAGAGVGLGLLTRGLGDIAGRR